MKKLRYENIEQNIAPVSIHAPTRGATCVYDNSIDSLLAKKIVEKEEIIEDIMEMENA